MRDLRNEKKKTNKNCIKRKNQCLRLLDTFMVPSTTLLNHNLDISYALCNADHPVIDHPDHHVIAKICKSPLFYHHQLLLANDCIAITTIILRSISRWPFADINSPFKSIPIPNGYSH